MLVDVDNGRDKTEQLTTLDSLVRVGQRVKSHRTADLTTKWFFFFKRKR